MKNKKSSLLITIILILLFGLLNAYLTQAKISHTNDFYNETIKLNNKYNWNIINALLTEIQIEGTLQAKTAAYNIENELRENYSNLNDLYNDLDKYDNEDTQLINIISKNIDNKYLNNIKTDNMFVAMRWGIFYDKSLDNSIINEKLKTWEVVTNKYFDTELANEAINKILYKDTTSLIGWDTRIFNDGKEKIQTLDLNKLKELYDQYGLEGLKNIELLCPAYITENGDIFGIPDVNTHGKQNDNDKIIVIQRINLYEQIINRNNDKISSLDNINIIKSEMNHSILLDKIYVIINIIILLILFILTSCIYNHDFGKK